MATRARRAVAACVVVGACWGAPVPAAEVPIGRSTFKNSNGFSGVAFAGPDRVVFLENGKPVLAGLGIRQRRIPLPAGFDLVTDIEGSGSTVAAVLSANEVDATPRAFRLRGTRWIPLDKGCAVQDIAVDGGRIAYDCAPAGKRGAEVRVRQADGRVVRIPHRDGPVAMSLAGSYVGLDTGSYDFTAPRWTYVADAVHGGAPTEITMPDWVRDDETQDGNGSTMVVRSTGAVVVTGLIDGRLRVGEVSRSGAVRMLDSATSPYGTTAVTVVGDRLFLEQMKPGPETPWGAQDMARLVELTGAGEERVVVPDNFSAIWFDVSGRSVAWTVGGCVFLDTGRGGRTARGNCRAVDVASVYADTTVKAPERLTVHLRCETSGARGCRGTAQVTVLDGSRRIAITNRVPIRIPRFGTATIRPAVTAAGRKVFADRKGPGWEKRGTRTYRLVGSIEYRLEAADRSKPKGVDHDPVRLYQGF